MGSILKAKCSCGYLSSDLYIGVGRYSYSSHDLIFYCDDCSLVQTESNDKENFVCLDCMNEITPYTKYDEEVDFGIEPSDNLKKYHCPKCKNESLYFEEYGIWD
jgi:hypothetical protein